MKLFSLLGFWMSMFAILAQSSYTIGWSFEKSLPFSGKTYTDITLLIGEQHHKVGKYWGSYINIGSMEPIYRQLPKNTILVTADMFRDTGTVVFITQNNTLLEVNEWVLKTPITSAKKVKMLDLNQPSQMGITHSNTANTNNLNLTWQFEQFTLNNEAQTNLFLIINEKQHAVTIVKGNCKLIEKNEFPDYKLPDNTLTAIVSTDTLVFVIQNGQELQVQKALKPNFAQTQEVKRIQY